MSEDYVGKAFRCRRAGRNIFHDALKSSQLITVLEQHKHYKRCQKKPCGLKLITLKVHKVHLASMHSMAFLLMKF